MHCQVVHFLFRARFNKHDHDLSPFHHIWPVNKSPKVYIQSFPAFCHRIGHVLGTKTVTSGLHMRQKRCLPCFATDLVTGPFIPEVKVAVGCVSRFFFLPTWHPWLRVTGFPRVTGEANYAHNLEQRRTICRQAALSVAPRVRRTCRITCSERGRSTLFIALCTAHFTSAHASMPLPVCGDVHAHAAHCPGRLSKTVEHKTLFSCSVRSYVMNRGFFSSEKIVCCTQRKGSLWTRRNKSFGCCEREHLILPLKNQFIREERNHTRKQDWN